MAGQFARGLRDSPGARLVAVCSRSADRARQYARGFAVARVYTDAADLAADPCVDVVYVATPPALHLPCVLTCLEAGKPVLCEKPLAVNAAQAQAMADAARRRRLFLMEAMWTRFLPSVVEARRLLREGAIGPVRRVEADLGFDRRAGGARWLRDPRLGGGCLLDVGVYPLTLAVMALGAPAAVRGKATIGPAGLDESAAIHLQYHDGAEAALTADLRAQTALRARVAGADGELWMRRDWWKGGPLTVATPRGTYEFDLPVVGNGYGHEADEVSRCLFAGALESDVMPLAHSIQALRIADELRRQWGVRYPCEVSADPGGDATAQVEAACT
jgi:predicted dehydrogenase